MNLFAYPFLDAKGAHDQWLKPSLLKQPCKRTSYCPFPHRSRVTHPTALVKSNDHDKFGSILQHSVRVLRRRRDRQPRRDMHPTGLPAQLLPPARSVQSTGAPIRSHTARDMAVAWQGVGVRNDRSKWKRELTLRIQPDNGPTQHQVFLRLTLAPLPGAHHSQQPGGSFWHRHPAAARDRDSRPLTGGPPYGATCSRHQWNSRHEKQLR